MSKIPYCWECMCGAHSSYYDFDKNLHLIQCHCPLCDMFICLNHAENHGFGNCEIVRPQRFMWDFIGAVVYNNLDELWSLLCKSITDGDFIGQPYYVWTSIVPEDDKIFYIPYRLMGWYQMLDNGPSKYRVELAKDDPELAHDALDDETVSEYAEKKWNLLWIQMHDFEEKFKHLCSQKYKIYGG